MGIKVAIRNRHRLKAIRLFSISREICRFSLNVVVGLLIGFLFATAFRCAAVRYSIKYCPSSLSSHSSNRSTPLLCGSCQGPSLLAITKSPVAMSAERSKFHTNENLVLVAVMTAKDFLNTRVVAAHSTWAKSIPGEVIFFSSEGSENESPPGIKVVGLRGVDDSYPPQKKSFMMLKYIHDHYLDKFRFFMRADDDVYIQGEALSKFLHSINSSGMPVIGKTGFGNKEELGKMYLQPDQNYCMGGPGMVMTKEILAKTVPHIKHCLKNLYTTHEDVEIGRCIRQFANASCTWSYQNDFNHNFGEPKGSFTHSLPTKDIKKAITLHPVKIPTYTHRLHQHVLSLKTASLRNRLQSLQQQIDAMNSLLESDNTIETSNPSSKVPVNGTIHRTTDDVVTWDFVSNQLYSSRYQNPRLGPQIDKRIGRQELYDEMLEMMKTKPLAPVTSAFKTKDIAYYFFRAHPLHGQEYVMGIEAKRPKPKNSKPPRNTLVQVYARRPFVEVEFREDIRSINFESSNPKESAEVIHEVDSTERVNFILPLAGRYPMFLKFMQNFEDVCLKTNENVSLTIMLFPNDPNDTSADVINYVTQLKQTYKDSSLSVVLMSGSFSRGVALQSASRRFLDDELLFCVDIDLDIQSPTLQRIRLNTVKGQTVYAPILFSDYDPQYLPPNTSNQYPIDAGEKFNLDRGYWRQYGFGMISTYKSDLDRAGGYKLDIKGWGLEDVDLLEKFISANVTIFRSVDEGMLHRFHPITCDRTLEEARYNMCIGTIATTSTSTKKMADTAYHTPEIFNRNNQVTKAKPTTPSGLHSNTLTMSS